MGKKRRRSTKTILKPFSALALLSSLTSQTSKASTSKDQTFSSMAASRVLSRLSSRLQPVALKINKSASLSPDTSFLKSASQSSVKRFSRISRLPVELSGVETMMPLYSAIASARLKSSLSIESHSWSLVPQGNSLPL